VSRSGELNYLRAIGPDRARHAFDKPFAGGGCGPLLADFGTFASFFPPPPRTLLDLGCGTGWTSVFFARMGYDVTGVDLAPDMILAANANKARYGVENATFVTGDFERLDYENVFDCVALFAALHHAEDDAAVLRGAYRALRPGGVCVTAEPGVGHTKHPITRAAVAEQGVTERDMPPSRILRLGTQAGFSKGEAFPMIPDLRRGRLRALKWAIWAIAFPRRNGYAVLTK
jgi:SAM-dependent methyltransferase